MAVFLVSLGDFDRCSAKTVPGERPAALNNLLPVLSTIGFKAMELRNLKYLAAGTSPRTLPFGL